jgi:small subunit ribosomal protein S2
VAKELARELINAGVHFGHGISRWNPKMKPYIFTKRGNIHIVDVRKTLEGILIAKKLLVDVVSSGKDVIFVGTKRQAQKAVEGAAAKCGMHFVSGRWLGGTLTNFRTIRSRLQRLTELETLEQSGSMEKESKKHASRLKRELKKIKANLDSIRNMTRLPGAVIIVDSKKEYLALREARKLGIPTIGIIDTDADPDTVDVVIPANDDSIRAIDLIMNELADAVSVGKTLVGTRLQEAKPRPKRIRSRRPTLARAGAEQAETAVAVESEEEPAAESSEPQSAEPTPPEQPEEKPNQ